MVAIITHKSILEKGNKYSRIFYNPDLQYRIKYMEEVKDLANKIARF